MNTGNRIDQSRAELKLALIEQVSLLVASCECYDAGDHFFAKSMAAALRVCLHHQGRSNALLHQLGLRCGRFYTAAPKPSSRQVPIGCGLVAMSFSPERQGHYVPLLGHLGHVDRLSFPEWWGGVVLRAPAGESMSRRDIVTAVADMDGGAHVDSRLDRTYAAFRTGSLLGMRVTGTEDGKIHMVIPLLSSGRDNQDQEPGPQEGLLSGPQYPSLRTITHEVLLTLEKYAPWAFKKAYVRSAWSLPHTISTPQTPTT